MNIGVPNCNMGKYKQTVEYTHALAPFILLVLIVLPESLLFIVKLTFVFQFF